MKKYWLNSLLLIISLFLLSLNLFPQRVNLKVFNITFPTACAPGYSYLEENYDVKFYFINLEVTNQSAYIKGYSTLHAQKTVELIDTFALELSQKLSVDSVLLNEEKQNNFIHEGDLLKIVLNAEDKSSEDYRVTIFYKGTAGSGGFFSGLTSTTAYPWNQRVTYTLSEPFRADDWFPVKQNLRDKADSAWVFITVDSSLMAGSNGLLTDVKTLTDGRKCYEWKSKYPIAYYLLSFSVGDYFEYSFYSPIGQYDSVFVQNYLYDSPGILEKYKPIIDQTGPLLRLFSDRFGRYPFASEKYGHSMAPMGGGMEHQTMTTLAGFEFGLVAHELAHQWFGDYLTCGTWQDIWINEGFASYAEYIALQELVSTSEALKWLVKTQNSAINSPFGSVYLTPSEAQDVQRIFSSALSYKKGAAIIHMLRYEINNDSVFYAALKDYVSSFANSTAIGEDFKQIIEDHTQSDFDWFFDQWYYGNGHPLFIGYWKQGRDSLVINSVQSSSTGENFFYKTHMDFRIRYEDGSKEDVRLLFDKPEMQFRISTEKAVLSVEMDPLSNVLKSAVLYKYVDPSKVYSVTPNPFKDELKITFRNNNKLRDIKLTGISGKDFLNQTSSLESVVLELSFLKPGIYLLNITEDGNKYPEKIIKH